MTQRDRLEATRRKRRGQAIVEGTGPSAKVERDYLRSLEKVRAEMLKQAKDELYPLIRSIERAGSLVGWASTEGRGVAARFGRAMTSSGPWRRSGEGRR